jgi:hypothetical protein
MCYARLQATSPTYGAVTIIVVSEPREEQFCVMCLDTAISGPHLIRAWKRRHSIEHCFRTLMHLLATGACQVHSEDAFYGHVVLRLMGCLVLFYASRVICEGRLMMKVLRREMRLAEWETYGGAGGPQVRHRHAPRWLSGNGSSPRPIGRNRRQCKDVAASCQETWCITPG